MDTRTVFSTLRGSAEPESMGLHCARGLTARRATRRENPPASPKAESGLAVLELVSRIIRLPIHHYLAAVNNCLPSFSIRPIVVIAAVFAVSWWVYVPIHELCHAFGCLLAGGEVTRLEIAPIYAAALLQRVFPFVAVGSDYAGQLTGFDTHGNDLTYLATDLFAFVPTILIGIPLLRSAARNRCKPLRSCVMLGAALPIAYAPFTSATGDYYEIGSILVSRTVSIWHPCFDLARWRSDDLFMLVRTLFFSHATASLGDACGVLAAFLVGIVVAFATYSIGTFWARLVVRHT